MHLWWVFLAFGMVCIKFVLNIRNGIKFVKHFFFKILLKNITHGWCWLCWPPSGICKLTAIAPAFKIGSLLYSFEKSSCRPAWNGNGCWPTSTSSLFSSNPFLGFFALTRQLSADKAMQNLCNTHCIHFNPIVSPLHSILPSLCCNPFQSRFPLQSLRPLQF